MMTDGQLIPDSSAASGGENLEVMQEAVNYNRYLRRLIQHHANDVNTALDFGAGIGTFSDSLALSPASVSCVEPDDRSRSQLEAAGYTTYCNVADVPSSSVDYVFTLNVLEHIDNDAAAAAELLRVLRPGGTLFVYVPAFNCLFTSMDRHVGHLRRYRRSNLRRLLETAGFDVQRQGYADPLGFLATLAYKLIDRDRSAPLNPATVAFYDRWVFPLSRMLSPLFSKVVGKNVYAVARKPASRRSEQEF